MTVNERLIGALSPLGLPVVPEIDTTQQERCLMFNYSAVGACYADDMPKFELYLIQVHYVCPSGWNSVAERKAVKRALFQAGFSWPEETSANDRSQTKRSEAKQHYVFECEWLEGIEDGTS